MDGLALDNGLFLWVGCEARRLVAVEVEMSTGSRGVT